MDLVGKYVQMKRFKGPSYWKLKEKGISIDCSDDGEMLWLFRDGKHVANVWSDIESQPHLVVGEPTLHPHVVKNFPDFFEWVDEKRVIAKPNWDSGYVVSENEFAHGMIGLKVSENAGMEMFISKSIYDVPHWVTEELTVGKRLVELFPELFEEVV